MKFVVDTNILVSFFRPNPVNSIISNSSSMRLELFSPDYVIDELKKNKPDILKYAGIDSEQFVRKLSKLLGFIKTVPNKPLKEFRPKAKKLSPHDKDIPIFALALKLGCPIWSNEPGFKKQDEVIVLSTREMIELFG